MADKDVPNNAEAIEFLELIAAAVRVPTSDAPGLAKKLGQPERYIYRWRNGEHGVSLRNALDMLKKSGVLELPELSERDMALFQMYKDGSTMEEITAKFAMSSLQVELVISDVRRQLATRASDAGVSMSMASETTSLTARLQAIEERLAALATEKDVVAGFERLRAAIDAATTGRTRAKKERSA